MERKLVQIFEQAMCCPTGLCGPAIDPELLRISAVLDTLEKHGILVERYNLSNAPLKFIQTPAAAEFLQHHGPEELPLILTDGKIWMAGRYPTNEEFARMLDFAPALLDEASARQDSGTEEAGSCCCGGSEEPAAETSCCCGSGEKESSRDSSSCCGSGSSSCCQ
ncbi:arsenite efflux transporter metallochaperone ArsD [Acidaminococcus massiliensis]|jgi:hypothetical protein|uniref:arsenite efflux transporter metallochaperone ArsD n=1 Tax=Acidaminococcus massiliensis TaxID=1852375 RepID=UPI0022E26528|nr:arsenite efflux transporter metallochaperone ArsD [Acidaminococcus massiliensis]